MGAIAAFFGFLAIMAAALGTHALKGRLDAQQALWFASATQILMFQTAALIGLAMQQLHWQLKRPLILHWVGLAFVVGTLLFCGSLYALALGAPRAVASFAPFGGVVLMAGWLLWFWAFRRLG